MPSTIKPLHSMGPSRSCGLTRCLTRAGNEPKRHRAAEPSKERVVPSINVAHRKVVTERRNEAVDASFDSIDKDGNNRIDSAEFVALLLGGGGTSGPKGGTGEPGSTGTGGPGVGKEDAGAEALATAQLEERFREADEDGNGVISRDEFLRWVVSDADHASVLQAVLGDKYAALVRDIEQTKSDEFQAETRTETLRGIGDVDHSMADVLHRAIVSVFWFFFLRFFVC